jgi:hypothetical protein
MFIQVFIEWEDVYYKRMVTVKLYFPQKRIIFAARNPDVLMADTIYPASLGTVAYQSPGSSQGLTLLA